MPRPGQTYAMLRRLADAHRNGKPLNQASDSVRKMVISGDVSDPTEKLTEKVAFNEDGDVVPSGVTLRDPSDFSSLRKDIFSGVLDEVRSTFPQTYGGVRMELSDVDYDDPEDYDLEEQKQALLYDKNLGRRIRGTVRLFDDKTGAQLDEKKLTLMKVPYLTERGTFLNGGSEYSTLNQMRLLPGPYSRRKANGDLEKHFNIQRGTGSAFRVRFEPASALYKLDIKQSSMRLYSLLHDLGVPDDELKQAWGPEVFEVNKQAYDSRVFDKAYGHLAKKPDPNATREQKVAVVREALDSMKMNRRVAQKNLPNLFDMQKSAAWREAFSKQAAEPTVSFPAHLAQAKALPAPAAPRAAAAPALARLGHSPLDLYHAIRVPETGGEKDPFIRTRHAPPTGSTAYGPVQITGRLAGDYLQRYPKLFPKDEHSYLQRFVAQSKQFSRFGKNKGATGYAPRYDYGGQGDLAAPADRAMYERVAQRMMGHIYEKNNRDVAKFIRAWRGEPDGNYEKKVQELLRTQKRGSANFDWMSHVMVKLAAGAVVLLPTSDGKYLLEKNPDEHEFNPNKLRPPGGGQEPGEDLKQTIVREIHEEFGIPPTAVESKIKLLGYEYREQFKGSAVFELKDHGLEPGTYQASNDPNETITLVEADLDDPDYVGPNLAKLSPTA